MAERSEAVAEHAVRDASAAYKVAADIATTEDVPPGYKRTEVGVMPEDWHIVSVKDIGMVRTGPFGTALKAAEYSRSDGVPLISVGEIREGYLRITEDTPLISKEVSRRLPQYVLKKGDIVFGRKGGVERSAPIGSNKDGWFLGSDGIVLRPSGQACSKYLAAQFGSSRVQNWLLQNAIGTTMASLNQSILKNAKIPFPSTENEQQAIATALSDADALIESLDRLVAKKRAIKQAAMQQLLTGQTRLPGFTGVWETKRLGDVAEIRSGGTPSTAMPAFWNGGVPWCTPTDITALRGRKYLSGTDRTISYAGLHASSAENIPPQCIIMTTRATIGECAINTVPMTTNQGFKNLVPLSADTEFLYYLMTTKKSELIQLCGGSTFLEICKKQLNSFELMLPRSREEQESIATVLSDMDTEIDALKRRRDKARQIKQGMMHELLTGRTRLV